ncbi:MAG: MoxR family ATPase [Deltaproteobacteria bacterium]|nr:MoxR family ATPase [Deltaproteobacteria bacterium]
MSSTTPTGQPPSKEVLDAFRRDLAKVRTEVAKVIVGNDEIVDGVLTCLLAGGHALLEGVPGLGKTMLVRTLAQALDLTFARVQFTPDLMPADILGTTVIVGEGSTKRFEFQKGPIFANIILADEINRATPKTQSALLEAMQEGSVTVAKNTYMLDQPFLVLATQNPLEMEGTYPLPEAQLDRFFYKLHVGFPDREELHAILDRTTGVTKSDVRPALTQQRILELRWMAREVPVARHVQDFAIRILQATHPDGPGAPDTVKRFVRFGSSPRGVQAVLMAAKIRALMDGRWAPGEDDVRATAVPALRHRVIMNFEGEAEGVKTDRVLADVLAQIKPEKK